MVRLLLRHGCDVNCQDESGRTALMYASMEEEKSDVVRLLIKCKSCDPNLQDKDGSTAIIHAVNNSNHKAIRILAKHQNTKSRVDVNKANKQGLTALDLAVKLRLADCCRTLIQDAYADANVKDKVVLFELLREGNRNTPLHPCSSPFYALSPRPLGTPIRPSYIRASPCQRPNSDLYRRVMMSPSAGPTPSPLFASRDEKERFSRLIQSPLARMPRDVYNYHYDGVTKTRPLTPISPRMGPSSPVGPHPIANCGVLRLPSIPSGKRIRAPNSKEDPDPT